MFARRVIVTIFFFSFEKQKMKQIEQYIFFFLIKMAIKTDNFINEVENNINNTPNPPLILETPNPPISTPTLLPTPAIVKSMAGDTYAAVKKKASEFANWILNYVPQIPKIVDKAYEKVKGEILRLYPIAQVAVKEPFLLRETTAALNIVNYTIEGKSGYDPESFLEKV